jgi:hypothetical protein
MEDTELNTHFTYIKEKIDKIDSDNMKDHGEIFTKLNTLAIEVAKLKVKSGFIGAIAGAIPASIIAIYFYIRSIAK